jgi:hemerythrin superfamily protein
MARRLLFQFCFGGRMQQQKNILSKLKNQISGFTTGSNDIVDVILEDHIAIKELIEIMKDSERDFSERRSAFEEFAPLLVAHAKPEEEIVYKRMKAITKLRELGYEGDVEHGIADQLVEEAKRTYDSDLLSARIKVLAEVVEHHIHEEESELLPAFKKETGPELRKTLGDLFLERKIDYLAAGDDNVIPDPKTEELEKRRH